MNLQHYPTPETDSQIGSLANAPDDTCCWIEIGLPRNLERRLAACHEALNRIANENLTLEQIERLAEKALTEASRRSGS